MERKVKNPSIRTLVILLTLILKCNTLCSTGNISTAMGTKIFMGRLEGQLLRLVTLRSPPKISFIVKVH